MTGEPPPVIPPPTDWRSSTPARVALDRSGTSLSTDPVLALRAAHARARDAVHAVLDRAELARALPPLETREVHSEARDREKYLRRPDLGRRLHGDCWTGLPDGPFDIALICADGLSAIAVQRHAPPFLSALAQALPDLTLSPVILASQSRVALSDDVGEAMHARLALILIGERPGLSVADSMGAYLTYAPRRGLRDSARNCISNIHGNGLLPPDAAAKAAWLIRAAITLKCTGISLKDDQPLQIGN